jgi:hypothetical protein
MECNLGSCGLPCMNRPTDTIATLNGGHFVNFTLRRWDWEVEDVGNINLVVLEGLNPCPTYCM